MYTLVKYCFVFCIISVMGLSPVWSVESEILPLDIADYTSFFKQHYRLAVDGNATSQLYIGALYENGLGVEKDLTLSHVYYNLASASGQPNAKKQRIKIEKLLSKKEFAEARKLAKLYRSGSGIEHSRQSDSLKFISKADTAQTNTNSNKGVDQNTKQAAASTATSEDAHVNFFNAVINNDTVQVRNLVSSGMNVDHKFNDDKTALMLASELGNLSTVGTLLDLGADANLKSNDNKTALNIARDSGHDYIAAVLSTKTIIASKLVKDIQIYLQKLDYQIGPADGLYGSKTQHYLKQFSYDYNQSFPFEISQRQLYTLKIAYNSYVTNKINEQKLQEGMLQEVEKDTPEPGDIVVTESTIATSNINDNSNIAEATENYNKDSNYTNTNNALVMSDTEILDTDTNINEKAELRLIGKYPDITGTYIAQTSAVFSKCGAYNQNINYHAKEIIKNLKENGKFEISYLAPLFNCSGEGKFTSDANVFKGNYNCTYQTIEGLQGAQRMNIVGQITDDKIQMKYHGSDTTSGQACVYDWERTLTIVQ